MMVAGSSGVALPRDRVWVEKTVVVGVVVTVHVLTRALAAKKRQHH